MTNGTVKETRFPWFELVILSLEYDRASHGSNSSYYLSNMTVLPMVTSSYYLSNMTVLPMVTSSYYLSNIIVLPMVTSSYYLANIIVLPMVRIAKTTSQTGWGFLWGGGRGLMAVPR